MTKETVRLSIRLPADIHKKIKKESHKTDISINAIMVEAIEKYVINDCNAVAL